MKSITIDELKAKFSEILKLVETEKEEIIIEYGKNRKKIAKIVSFEEEKEREFGIYEGKFEIPDDFDKENKEINKIFYESEIFPK
ncbi:MAG: type II toxin-antitoxin system prevent-host-death family antitoxin [Aquificae bacterium]|nr:type II toxin-antitoxin system prevent-host-death family antitoxin [Aquificota bacterium]